MTPDQEKKLDRIGWKLDILVSDDGNEGQIPRLRDDHDTLKANVNSQLSYWRGAIAVTAFLVLVFGGILITHIMEGK